MSPDFAAGLMVGVMATLASVTVGVAVAGYWRRSAPPPATLFSTRCGGTDGYWRTVMANAAMTGKPSSTPSPESPR